MIFGFLKQLPALPSNCVTDFTCPPFNGTAASNPLDVFRLYQEFYGIPNEVTLAMLLFGIAAGIFAYNRNLAGVAVMGIYMTSIGSASWLNNVYIAPQYHVITYLIIVAIASVVVIAFIKTLRE